jgi:predicted NBD/HSP70 family sugar kinase
VLRTETGITDGRHGSEFVQMVDLVATGQASSRVDLARLTGLSRATVSKRVDVLLRQGLLIETGPGPSAGGRQPIMLSLNPAAGVVLAADIGASHYEIAVYDLEGTLQRITRDFLDIAAGPEAVLSQLVTHFDQLLGEVGRTRGEIRAIGMGLPGPVEFATGTVVRPPIMPGWDGFVVPQWFQEHYPAPVIVDNDVNVLALGTYSSGDFASEHMLVVKVGTGIGCGIVSGGHLHRGADGAAGDIGHVRLADQDDAICNCGNTGCLEAVASGSAIAAALRKQGLDVQTSWEVVQLAQDGESHVLAAVRSAGHHIGEVLASLVNFYNPDTIVVGGALAELRDELLAAIRGVIYQRALPLATRRLTIASCGEHAAVAGAALLARQRALSPSAVAGWLSGPPLTPTVA